MYKPKYTLQMDDLSYDNYIDLLMDKTIECARFYDIVTCDVLKDVNNRIKNGRNSISKCGCS